MEKDVLVALSPIQEISDLDLSYLLNQLSSVSGDIDLSEKSIEELIREAESMSNNVQVPKNYPQSNGDVEKFEEQKKPLTTNVFKSTIEILSEVTNKIQSKLALGGEDSKSKETNTPFAFQRAHSSRSNQSTKSLVRNAVSNSPPKSYQNSCAHPKPVSAPAKSNPRPKDNNAKPWNKTRPNINAGKSTMSNHMKRNVDKIQNTGKSNPRALSNKTNKNDVKAVEKKKFGVGTSVRDLHQMRKQDGKASGPVKTTFYSQRSCEIRSDPSINTDSIHSDRICSGDSSFMRHLSQENIRLQLQMKEIQEKYDSQLQTLTIKCEQLQLTQTSNLSERCKTDTSCQTEKEMRDVGCQPSLDNSEEPPNQKDSNRIINNEPNETFSHSNDVKPNNQDTREYGDFGFENLDLDDDFVPWKEAEKVPKKPEKTDISSKRTKPSVANTVRRLKSSQVIHAGDRQLLATIRGMQSELDTTKRENLRLKSELASFKVRKVDRFKGAIRRTSGTQTVGLAASTAMIYDPSLFQNQTDTKNLIAENSSLKAKVGSLEVELQALKAKRLQDLQLLQAKHEDEISALISQKSLLVNKLDAALAMTCR